MKRFIDSIIKGLIHIIVFLVIFFIAIVIFLYFFSTKNNMPIENAVSHFQVIGNEIIDFTLTDKNSVNVLLSDNNIEKITTSSNTNYYYSQLDNTGKVIYTSLENNIINLKKENYVIDFSTKFNDLLQETTGEQQLNKSFQSALDAFFYDHPEVFYLDLTKISLVIKCTSIGPIKTYTVQIAPQDNKNYLHRDFNTESDVDIAINKVENIKDNIIDTVSNDNTYNKILKVHDILINSIEYDSSANKTHTHNIYGALVQNEVVCEGYAKAFKYILDSLDINCILVSGTASNSSGETESHMWNYVKLNDSWYGIDVTWDDPIIIGGNVENNTRYDYFLKSNGTFIKSHSPSGRISDTGMLFTLPALSNINYK